LKKIKNVTITYPCMGYDDETSSWLPPPYNKSSSDVRGALSLLISLQRVLVVFDMYEDVLIGPADYDAFEVIEKLADNAPSLPACRVDFLIAHQGTDHEEDENRIREIECDIFGRAYLRSPRARWDELRGEVTSDNGGYPIRELISFRPGIRPIGDRSVRL
jgi:hypothetical protein